jgi:hypothetical protein
MNISISLDGASSAVADIKTVELLKIIGDIEGVNTNPPVESAEKIARMGGLEILAAIMTSAAAYQLASALRDFVTRQDVKVSVTKPNGEKLEITAQRGEPQAVADIIGFLTGQHEKRSVSLEIEESQKELTSPEQNDLEGISENPKTDQ